MTKLQNSYGKIRKYNSDEKKIISNEIDNDSELGAFILEKMRRFVSFHGYHLKHISKQRFGREYKSQLSWMRDLLHAKAISDTNFIDHAFLSAALFCDTALDGNDANLTNSVMILKCKLLSQVKDHHSQALPMGHLNNDLTLVPTLSGLNCPRSVIFSPTLFSHYAVIVVDQLIKLGIPPRMIVIKNFSINRIKSELKRDGFHRVAKKVWRKIILKSSENKAPGSYGTRELLDDLCITNYNLAKICQENNIEILFVNDFVESNNLLSKLNPDYGFFAGGGLIDESTISIFKKGIINTHLGPLPEYKGMDVIEAPILDGNFAFTTVTAHFMSKDLDAGPILGRFTVSSDLYHDFDSLGNEFRAIQPMLALSCMLKYVRDESVLIHQSISAGRQYYFLHKELSIVAHDIVSSRFNKNSKVKFSVKNLIQAILVK